MCGRYTLSSELDELVETFDVSEVVLANHRPRFNIAPTQEAPVVVQGPHGRRLGALRWGLVPYWAEDPAVGNRMINARSESVLSRRAFREAFRRRRCLVPADGFYEWMPVEETSSGGEPVRARRPAIRKVPFWIHRPDRRPFAFAGLWERWAPKEGGRPVETCTILTTVANDKLRPIHPRMPVILPEAAYDAWLTTPAADAPGLLALLGPCPSEPMAFYRVSQRVNNVRNDDPECIVPFSRAA